MKFIDAEITHEDEGAPHIARPPRPRRRRVYTSLIVTFSVLFGTVGVIYSIFPNRHSEILTMAIAAHVSDDAPALTNPTGLEIRAWSLGIFGEAVPWPEVTEGLVPKSSSLIEVFKRPLAIVRYELGGESVSIAFWRARDAPPRTRRRTEDGLYSVSWRRKRFTCIAIGPAASKASWTKHFGAP